MQLQADTLTGTESIIGRKQDCNETILISVMHKTLDLGRKPDVFLSNSMR